MPTPSPRLLVVDDERAQMKALCDTLEPAGYTTTGFTSSRAALAILQEQVFDLVLTDLNMPEMDGITFLQAAREIDPDMAAVVMTGQGAVSTAVQAMQAGALDYIVKPFKLSAVLPVLARALGLQKLRLENIDLQQAMGIYELSMVIRSTLDFDTVLQKVADAAMGHAQVRSVSILLPIENGNALRVELARGENAAQDEGKRVLVNQEISGWIERSLRRASDVAEAAGDDSALHHSLPEIPEGSCIPMLSGGKLIGILSFASKNLRRQDSPGQIKALNVLASAAASALEAASLLEQLRSAERRYRSLSESAADIIFRYELHPHPHMAYINPAVTSIVGYSPEEHYADDELMLRIAHADDQRLMETLLRGDFSSGNIATLRFLHRNGKQVWIEQHNTIVADGDGRVIAIDGVARDITERKHLEEQLRQSQKMEAIGLLAGGVAHDFNNLLTVIGGYSNMILEEDDPSDETAEKLNEIKRAADQAAGLTRGLLAFGRREIVQPKVLSLNTVVENSSKMLRRIIGENIELITTLEAKQGLIKADPGLMEQILMNLVVNAKGAMPLGGSITLETQDKSARDAVAAGAPSGATDYVMLAVTDTGHGMDASIQARIFEPFFTTKALGQGTGLGLSIVYGIVKQSGGTIQVFSKPGSGTRFEIVLPRTETSAESTDSIARRSERLRGSETILIVEDDPGVRELITAMIRKDGYQILIAHDGNDALRICKKDGGRISLILTDVVMPGMNGPQLLQALRNFNSKMKVLFMSGYASDALAGLGADDLGTPFIQKPFTSADLLRKIRDVIDKRVSAKGT